MKLVSLASLLTLCCCAEVYIGDLEVKGERIVAYGNKLDRYLGIPYARREAMFELPTEVSYEGRYVDLDATKPGAICPGIPNPLPLPHSEGFYASSSQKDFFNCLNLDVYRPKADWYSIKTERKKRVVVQIHNNSFKEMTRNQAHNQPEGIFRFAPNQVYVSVGTTMGPLAVWYKDESFNNVAVHEVILALKWVQKYITHFGGDPDDVVLMGQSTSAALAEIALIYLRDFSKFGFEKPPVHKLILISGTGSLHPPATIEEQVARQQSILSQIPACQQNMDTCLSSITVDDINNAAAISPAYIVPSFDLINMPASIYDMRISGQFLHVQSVLVTVNEHDSALAIAKLVSLIKKLGEDVAFKKLNLDFDEFRKVYKSDDPIECIGRWMNDVIFIRPAQELLEVYRNQGIATYECFNTLRYLEAPIFTRPSIDGIDAQKLAETVTALNKLGFSNYLDQAALFDANIYSPSNSPSVRFSALTSRKALAAIAAPLAEYIRKGSVQEVLHVPEPDTRGYMSVRVNPLPKPEYLSEGITVPNVFTKYVHPSINAPFNEY